MFEKKTARLSHAMHFKAAQAMQAIREQAEREKWELQQIADWLTKTCGFPVSIGAVRPVLKTIGMEVPRAHARPEPVPAAPLSGEWLALAESLREARQWIKLDNDRLAALENARQEMNAQRAILFRDLAALRAEVASLKADLGIKAAA